LGLGRVRGLGTGRLTVARLLGLLGLGRVRRLPARRLLLLRFGPLSLVGILRGGRVRRVLAHAFPWLRCFGGACCATGLYRRPRRTGADGCGPERSGPPLRKSYGPSG